MITYDIQYYNGDFCQSRLSGYQWTPAEKESPWRVHEDEITIEESAKPEDKITLDNGEIVTVLEIRGR